MNRNIVLVDDSKIIRFLFENWFKKNINTYDFYTFVCYEDLINVIDDIKPELIICDNKIQKNKMSGIEFIKYMKKNNIMYKYLLLSAGDIEMTDDLYNDDMFVKFLTKPTDLNHFKKIIT